LFPLPAPQKDSYKREEAGWVSPTKKDMRKRKMHKRKRNTNEINKAIIGANDAIALGDARLRN
jgi:hypothetical protein